MKLVRYKNVVTENRDYPGLIECRLSHEIKETKGALTYIGPKITPLVWHQTLSFFKWVYDTTHSESQVRLYVNASLNGWAAWAYPQEARSGMSARELDTPDARRQRESFRDADGWIYFGTVHHHCGGGAFQSGTDESNEHTQDGIHITVGNLDKDHYSLHTRFYLGGFKFNINLASFWDIGADLARMTPDSVHGTIAEHQMGIPNDGGFPPLWKDNLIEIKSGPTITTGRDSATTYGDHWGLYQGGNDKHKGVTKWANRGCRIQQAVGEMIDMADTYRSDIEDVLNAVEALSQDGLLWDIAETLIDLDLACEDVRPLLEDAWEKRAARGETNTTVEPKAKNDLPDNPGGMTDAEWDAWRGK